MAELKSLAKDTAIYGASSIIGKFLNYFLVPIYTFSLPAASGGYGVITKMYAIVALLLVVLTFGMETGFFRFANKGDDDPKKVYSVSLLMVGGVSLLFLLLCLVFLNPIAGLMGYGEHPWYLGMMLIVLAMDAIQAIPFAYLRYKKRPIKFAGLKLLFIFVSILLNILYFVVMKGDDVGVAFLINLICSFVVMLGLIPEFREFRYCPDRLLMKRMLYYSFPILILGDAAVRKKRRCGGREKRFVPARKRREAGFPRRELRRSDQQLCLSQYHGEGQAGASAGNAARAEKGRNVCHP